MKLFTLILCLLWLGQTVGLSHTCNYQEQTVQCVSKNKAYTECSLGPAGMDVKSVTLLKQDSAEQCVYSAVYNAGEEKGAFGYYNYDMWTYQGCGGVFEYCYEYPECPGNKELVSCWFPDDNGYHECDTESDLTIMYAFLKKKYSSNHCNYHRNTYGIVGGYGYGQYGYDGRKLWVENECGGIFEVCYAASCPGTKQVVKCRSNGNSYNECDLGPKGSSLISIKEENLIHHSDNLCTYFDRSYEDLNEEFAFEEEGFFGIVHGGDGNLKMWTTLGCFADFEYCLNYPTCPGKFELVTCLFPDNNGYNECVTNDNYKIMFASVQKPYGSIGICSYVSEIDDDVNYGRYGYNETTLWVLDGCGGVFNVCYADTCEYPKQTVQCLSENKAYTECSLGPAGMGVKSVTLLKQDSAEQCVYSAVYNAGEEKGAFGYYNYDMWTYQGCGGVFEFCYEYPECPGKKELVSCWFPDDDGYHECDTESDLTIMYAFLKKKYSSNPCNYHRNTYGIVGGDGYGQYGYDGRKLWVKNECGGIFEVCYAASCPGTKQVVKCRSNGNSYKECDLGPQGSSLISIKEENLIHHSDNLCTYFDRSYEDLNEEFAFEEEGFFGIVHGDDGNLKMWTTLGCFADFEYCLNYPTCPGKFELVTCLFPDNNGYNECVTNDNYKIMFASVQKPYGSIGICSYVSEIDDGVNYGRYGYNETTLWVLDGCGGVFNVCYADTCEYPKQTVQCVSENKAYTECSLGPAGMGVKSVTLLKQDSAEQCVYSAVYNAGEEKGAFGYYNYDMWTYQGCGGVFEYCYEYPECPGKKELVSCWFPDDDGYHECDTESDLTIMYAFLKKKYSSNPCNYHRNTYGIVGGDGYGQYGYDGRKLWVKNECGGIFEVCYAASCPGTKQVVKCRSNGNSYKECDLGPQGSSLISIKEENLIHHSDNLCTYFDRSYEDLNEEFAFEEEGFFGIVHGDDGNLKMWTSLGCFADFEYCLNYPTCPGKFELVTCLFPDNNGYNECVTNDNYKIMFASVQKPYGSIDICSYVSEIDDGVNYGRYGYNETTLWVLDGCGGVFNVCYAEGTPDTCRQLRRKPEC